jgi:putative RNA 2'-phosphotransferase
LLSKANAAGTELSETMLREVVAGYEKQRFALSPDGQRIRASQGHSIQVDLGLEPTEPPATLYHGTALRNLGSILRQGLKRQGRQYVHLSPDVATAKQVGQRHGKPVVVQIDAGLMQTNGFVFFQAENGVWLTEEVPAQYLRTL